MENCHIEEPDYLADPAPPSDAEEMLAEPPATAEAAQCPICDNQEEENVLGFCFPIKVKRGYCGHYGCEHCIAECETCRRASCTKCLKRCVECAEFLCDGCAVSDPDHTDLVYHPACVPDDVQRKIAVEEIADAAMEEAFAESMRD